MLYLHALFSLFSPVHQLTTLLLRDQRRHNLSLGRTLPLSLSCFYCSGSKEDVALNATNLSRFDSFQKRIILTILTLRDQRRHISGYTLAWGLQRIAG